MMKNLVIEKNILACIIIENKLMDKAVVYIEDNDFSDKFNKVIYQRMLSLYHKNYAIDYTTLMTDFNDYGIKVDVNYLIDITNLLPSTNGFDTYLKQLKEQSNRAKIKQYYELVINDKGLSSYDIVDYMKEKFDSLKHIDNTELLNMQDNIDKYVQDIKCGRGVESGIPTLYHSVDEKLSITGGSLIVIGARPGVGKSALALNFIHHFAMQNKKILFISLEMTEKEIINRLISLTAEVDATKITRRLPLTEQEKTRIVVAKQKLKKHFINIFDRGSLKVENLVQLCNKLKQKQELDILVVDYIGLLDSSQYQGQRTNQIGYISRKLKQIAMDLKIPVIALSQLNRNVVDKANGKMREPNLSDLRDSGSVEQDANAVLFIHSLSKDTDDFDDKYVKLIIAKNRSGSVGKIFMNFKSNIMRFREGELDNGVLREYPLQEIKTLEV